MVRCSNHNSTPFYVPSLCLSGMGGTTHAGNSLVKWSRRKTKSWNLRLTVTGVVGNPARFVWPEIRQSSCFHLMMTAHPCSDSIADIHLLRSLMLLDRLPDLDSHPLSAPTRHGMFTLSRRSFHRHGSRLSSIYARRNGFREGRPFIICEDASLSMM